MFPEAKQITENRVNPRKLLIVSHPKTGKSELAMQLEDSLLVDLEDSTSFYSGPAKVANLKQMYADFIKGKDKVPPYELYAGKYFKHLVDKAAKEGPLCKYLIIDTATALEDIAEVMATVKYKGTIIGKSFDKDSVVELDRGAGYVKLRNMFKNIYGALAPVYTDCLILLAHPKDASIVLDGKEISVTELNLTGKLKQIVTSDMDAMGTMYRDKKRPINILSFKTSKQDLISGSRCPHLRNIDIEISEMTEEGIVTHWDKIFV